MIREECDHRDKQWTRHRPCVYCECGARLYNGTVPRTVKEQNELIDLFDKIRGMGS